MFANMIINGINTDALQMDNILTFFLNTIWATQSIIEHNAKTITGTKNPVGISDIIHRSLPLLYQVIESFVSGISST